MNIKECFFFANKTDAWSASTSYVFQHILHRLKRNINNTLKREIRFIYFSSNMKFQTEIFQGMFATIFIIRPCKFYVNL